jgi:GNAT superfamily N-acetyltransferase
VGCESDGVAISYHLVTEADIDAATNTVTLAFLGDPVWSVALARPDGSTAHHAPFWRIYVEAAVGFGSAFMTDGAIAVATWTPPGKVDLTPEQLAALDDIVATNLEPEAVQAIEELFERFESNHPRDVPHAYLGLLATHPDHSGHGFGQQLLAENLAQFDSLGIPTYLESTNPGANNHRYERAGFAAIGEFRAVLNDAAVTAMWRPAR